MLGWDNFIWITCARSVLCLITRKFKAISSLMSHPPVKTMLICIFLFELLILALSSLPDMKELMHLFSTCHNLGAPQAVKRVETINVDRNVQAFGTLFIGYSFVSSFPPTLACGREWQLKWIHKTSLEKSAMCRRRQQNIEMNGFRELSEQGETAPNIYVTIKLPCVWTYDLETCHPVINPRLFTSIYQSLIPPKHNWWNRAQSPFWTTPT